MTPSRKPPRSRAQSPRDNSSPQTIRALQQNKQEAAQHLREYFARLEQAERETDPKPEP